MRARAQTLFVLFVAVGCLLGLAAGAVYAAPLAGDASGGTVSVTYESVDVPKGIHDEQWTTSTLSIADDHTVADLNLTLTIHHTWDMDLDIYLVSPAGTEVELTSDNGGPKNHYLGTTFDDEADISIVDGQAPFSGSYRPEEPLTAFDGEPAAGVWTLRIYDDNEDDEGTLDAWSLTVGITSTLGLAPRAVSGAACQGDTVTHSFELLNTSATTDTYDLSTEGSAWGAMVSPDALTLGPEASGALTVTVLVPAYASDGVSDTLTLLATGRTEPHGTAQATVETVAGSTWRVDVSGDPTLYAAHASDGEALYLFDGRDVGWFGTSQRVQVFEPSAGWSEVSDHQEGWFQGGVAGYHATSGRFLYAPGFGFSSDAVRHFMAYDPQADSWFTDTLADRPAALGGGAGGVTADDSTFVWAGGGLSADFVLFGYVMWSARPLTYTPVYTYDIASDTWFTATTLYTVGFNAPGHAMVGDQLYMAGGGPGGHAFYVYDVGDDAWTPLADLPAGRLSPALVHDPLGERMLLVGGLDPETGQASADVLVYDIAGGAWAPFVSLKQPILGSVGAFIDGELHTIGGGVTTTFALSPQPHERILPTCPPLTDTHVTGTVIDSVEGAPVEGAMVSAVGLGQEPPLTPTLAAWTDAQGAYTLTVLAPAFYDIVASSDLYDARSETVYVPPAGVVQDFVLGPALGRVPSATYSVTLPWGETAVETLTVENLGYSTLDYALMEVNGGHQEPVLAIPAAANPRVQSSQAPDSYGPAPQPPGRRVDGASATRQPEVVLSTDGKPAYGVELLQDDVRHWPDVAASMQSERIADLASGAFYGGDFAGADFSRFYVLDEDTRTLVAIHTGSGTLETIGTCAPWWNEVWTGMAWDFTTGTMYASATSGSRSTLYTVDLETGLTRPVGHMDGVPLVIDIAIDNAGQMFGLDLVEDALYAIDKATAASTFVGELGYAANYAQGMDFDASTGVLYWAAYGDGGAELRVIDTQTGASAYVGAYPAGYEIGAFAVASVPDIPWLVPKPDEGGVPPLSVVTPWLVFDAGAVQALGVFDGDLIVTTNDESLPAVEMPLQLTIVENPAAGAISGTISSDHPGGPVLEASVHLEAATGFSDTLLTDAAGGYWRWLRPDDLGLFTITVSAPHYLTSVSTAVVTSTPLTYDLRLQYTGPRLVLDRDAISETVMWGEVATPTLVISNAGDAPLSFERETYALLYEEGFETNDGGYVVDGDRPTWAWGAPESGPRAAHSGQRAWATNLGGDYRTNEESTLTSPPIDLSAYAGQGVVVEWWEWAVVEQGWDHWYTEVSRDGGQTWHRLQTRTGSSGGWVQRRYTLDSTYAVEDLRLRFGLLSDRAPGRRRRRW